MPCRTTLVAPEVRSRFAFVRVVAIPSAPTVPPRQEWLIVEWPEHEESPSDYWLSNLAADESRERLARLARLRWTIELDYRQLKGELGSTITEERSYLGFTTTARSSPARTPSHPRAARPKSPR